MKSTTRRLTARDHIHLVVSVLLVAGVAVFMDIAGLTDLSRRAVQLAVAALGAFVLVLMAEHRRRRPPASSKWDDGSGRP